MTSIESSPHSPENVPKHLHFCGYHNNYHIASTGRPCLEDVIEHGEPIGDRKRDGGGNTGVVWEEGTVLITCQPRGSEKEQVKGAGHTHICEMVGALGIVVLAVKCSVTYKPARLQVFIVQERQYPCCEPALEQLGVIPRGFRPTKLSSGYDQDSSNNPNPLLCLRKRIPCNGTECAGIQPCAMGTGVTTQI